MFKITNLFADLGMLHAIFADSHPLIVMHGGEGHINFVVNFFKNYTKTASGSSLSLLKPELLGNEKLCSETLKEFVFN